MFITGMDDPNNRFTPIKEALKDDKRIKYHNDYLTNLLAAIKYVITYYFTYKCTCSYNFQYLVTSEVLAKQKLK